VLTLFEFLPIGVDKIIMETVTFNIDDVISSVLAGAEYSAPPTSDADASAVGGPVDHALVPEVDHTEQDVPQADEGAAQEESGGAASEEVAAIPQPRGLNFPKNLSVGSTQYMTLMYETWEKLAKIPFITYKALKPAESDIVEFERLLNHFYQTVPLIFLEGTRSTLWFMGSLNFMTGPGKRGVFMVLATCHFPSIVKGLGWAECPPLLRISDQGVVTRNTHYDQAPGSHSSRNGPHGPPRGGPRNGPRNGPRGGAHGGARGGARSGTGPRRDHRNEEQKAAEPAI
jgi:hypothetical protein